MRVGWKCDSPHGGVISIRKICQLRERCGGHGGCEGVWEGETDVKKWDNPQVVVKGIGKVLVDGEVSW